MHLNVERFSRKMDVKSFAFKYMISMIFSGGLQLHRTNRMPERASLTSSLSEPAMTGGSSDWVRMCFVGIFGYVKCFGLMFRSSHAIPRPSVCPQSPRVDGGGSTPEPALAVPLVWLPVKMEFALDKHLTFRTDKAQPYNCPLLNAGEDSCFLWSFCLYTKLGYSISQQRFFFFEGHRYVWLSLAFRTRWSHCITIVSVNIKRAYFLEGFKSCVFSSSLSHDGTEH